MRKIIGLSIEGTPEFHAIGDVGDYATLCGLDGTETDVSPQAEIPVPRGQKITCTACKTIFLTCRNYRLSDFAA